MLAKADPSQKLYTRMRLWEYSDQFVVEPSDGSSGSCLAISRLNGALTLLGLFSISFLSLRFRTY